MRFSPDFEKLNGIHDATDRIQLAKRFLNAYTHDDFALLNKEYPHILGEYAQGQTVRDIASICETMRNANEIFALTNAEDDIEVSDMLNCGLPPIFMGMGASDAEPENFVASSFQLSYLRAIEGENYGAWLARAANKVDERFPWYRLGMRYHDDGSFRYIVDDAELRHVSECGHLREDCSYILQQLITLHLADVATVCDSSHIRPAQMAYSGISCLWLGLVERMSGGRAYRCEACGKPVVAYGERRKKKYCCDACRKWKSDNPGMMRNSWYYETRNTWHA